MYQRKRSFPEIPIFFFLERTRKALARISPKPTLFKTPFWEVATPANVGFIKFLKIGKVPSESAPKERKILPFGSSFLSLAF